MIFVWVLDSSKIQLLLEILIFLSDNETYEDMDYDHVYHVLTSMPPDTRWVFEEEAVRFHRIVMDLAELVHDPRHLKSMDHETKVRILARLQAPLLISCLRLVNRIYPQGGGGGGPPAPNPHR